MANPAIISCTANDWTKVADNVLEGQLHKMSNNPNRYLQTYREAGGPTPASGDPSEGVLILTPGQDSIAIVAAAGCPIDVWIYSDGAQGSLRVDL
jgi:hypothetical protein